MSRDLLELRLKDAQRRLRTQRRRTAALAAAGSIALLACLRPVRSEVARVRRMEVVGSGGAVIGTFGISASAAGQSSRGKPDALGWALEDTASGARAYSRLHSGDRGGASLLELGTSESSWISLAATGTGSVVDVGVKDRREILLMANEGQSSLAYWIDQGWEEPCVLRVAHETGEPYIQGEDERAGTTFDIR